MGTLLRLAFRNLVQARRRSLLLGSAIAIVTALLVLLLSISAGIRDNLVRSATTLSAGHVVVGGFYKVTPGSVAPVLDGATRLRQIVEENTPGLDYIIDRGRGWAKVVSPTGSTQAGLHGVDLAREPRFASALQLAAEKEYEDGGTDEVKGDLSRLGEPDTAVIFANQARRLEVDVGDVLTIQTETVGGRTNTVDVTVVAVARDVGLLSTFSLYIPQTTLRSLYQLDDDTTGAVWVYLKDIDDADATMAHLREVFAREGYAIMDHEANPFFFKFETAAGEDWTGQKLDLTTWDDEVSFLTWVVTAFDSVTLFLVGILVVIIAVGIMNAMWNAVRERTREIGTMRAIGMTRGRVLALFLGEATLLGLLSTATGAALGAVVALAVDAAAIPVPIDAMRTILLSDTLHLAPSVGGLAGAVLALTLFTSLSALWPALRAAWMRPIVALGHAD